MAQLSDPLLNAIAKIVSTVGEYDISPERAGDCLALFIDEKTSEIKDRILATTVSVPLSIRAVTLLEKAASERGLTDLSATIVAAFSKAESPKSEAPPAAAKKRPRVGKTGPQIAEDLWAKRKSGTLIDKNTREALEEISAQYVFENYEGATRDKVNHAFTMMAKRGYGHRIRLGFSFVNNEAPPVDQIVGSPEAPPAVGSSYAPPTPPAIGNVA